MGLYQKFLNFEVVINVKTEKEWKELIERFKILKIDARWMGKTSFEELHMNAGRRVMRDGDVCIEYTPYKGMTFSDKQGYIDYGCEVCSVDEFLKATN